ncbi:hypothetical protein AAF712_016159 [Marasmius tenuissimus]|uniref:O-methyltransferase domain-containing protein n=1 Tax=Marasmius tenuissimus TaxID=585030 RepID=A0ABR2Z6N1_9AGAR
MIAISNPEVHQLLDLITDGIAAFDKTGALSPNLNDTSGYMSSDFGKNNEQAKHLSAVIAAAALQLAAIFQPPQNLLLNLASGAYKTAALRVCLEGNVTEILREAGPKGAHVREISAINGLDPKILARFLRYLATLHIYRELSPGVFANNRVSAVMDTGKDVKELFDSTDEVCKAAMLSWETITDPAYPAITPLNKTFPTSNRRASENHELHEQNHEEEDAGPPDAVTIFDLLQRPEEAARHRRFAVAMEGMSGVQPLECLSRGKSYSFYNSFRPRITAITAYEWESLPEKAVVVDVGGGVGTISLELTKRYPKLNFVVQDLSGFVEKGSELASYNRLAAAAHNFFKPQPRKDASIYLLRHVVHNWSDEDSIKILTRLREAAREDTKLILLEIIMPYACRTSNADTGASLDPGTVIPGASAGEAQVPLLANFGAVNEFAYLMDITMFALCKDSSERTIDQFAVLFQKSGWKLTRVNRLAEDAGMWQAIEGVPV